MQHKATMPENKLIHFFWTNKAWLYHQRVPHRHSPTWPVHSYPYTSCWGSSSPSCCVPPSSSCAPPPPFQIWLSTSCRVHGGWCPWSVSGRRTRSRGASTWRPSRLGNGLCTLPQTLLLASCVVLCAEDKEWTG